LGALALAFAVSVFHIDRFQTFDPHGQAVVLGLFDRLGLIKAPDMRAEMSITQAYVTSINDTTAVEFVRLYAWWLSLWAIGIALFAEAQRESTLFLSAGCICGCFAVLFLGGTTAGMVALVGCSVVTFLLRFLATPNPSVKGTSRKRAAPYVER
jgi:hypothetical protein